MLLQAYFFHLHSRMSKNHRVDRNSSFGERKLLADQRFWSEVISNLPPSLEEKKQTFRRHFSTALLGLQVLLSVSGADTFQTFEGILEVSCWCLPNLGWMLENKDGILLFLSQPTQQGETCQSVLSQNYFSIPKVLT